MEVSICPKSRKIKENNDNVSGALHPKSDVARLYIKRKEGGRYLMSVERFVRA